MTRVFIHDHERDVEALYALRLERDGFLVTDEPGTADVLVLDADEEGRSIASDHPGLPLIVTSLRFEGEEPDLAQAADCFLLKPFPLYVLPSAITRALEGPKPAA